MVLASQPPRDHSWEKEYAPRVSGKSLALVAAIYCAWIAFLVVVAVGRWHGALN
jgi:hypothetical protein